MRLQGKNIILTGASRGFGRYLSNVLWNEGANLLLVSRTIYGVFTELPERDGQVCGRLEVDLSMSGRNAEEQIVLQATAMWPIIDGLVNNAAIQGPVGPAWKSHRTDYIDTLCVNLLAPIELCRLVIPFMLREHKGKIVNLSGGGAAGVRPNYSAYATAKTGLVRFSECLAAELAGTGIDVNCVAPGKMPTGMLPEGETANEDSMQKAAELIVFLLSDESNGITGKLISAIWDNLDELKTRRRPLPDDLYTLRRVT